MGAWQVIASQDLVCVCVCVRVFILISFSLYLCTSAYVSARSMLGCACERALFSPALPVKPPSPALPFPPSVPFLPSLCLFYIHPPSPSPPVPFRHRLRHLRLSVSHDALQFACCSPGCRWNCSDIYWERRGEVRRGEKVKENDGGEKEGEDDSLLYQKCNKGLEGGEGTHTLNLYHYVFSSVL